MVWEYRSQRELLLDDVYTHGSERHGHLKRHSQSRETRTAGRRRNDG